MKNLKTILGSMALLAAVSMLQSCGAGGAKKTGEADADSLKAVAVKTVTTKTETVQVVAEFTGNIEANVVNNIGPNQPGRIHKILVDVGASVGQGQLLVQMDPTQYSQAAVQLANLQEDYNRTKSVYEAGGLSRQTLDQMETQLTVLKQQVQNLKENIELRSPVSGVVTDRRFDAGDMYASGGILTVMQINPLKVTMDVSEQYFPQVKKGMPVNIAVDLFPDETFTGKVSLIYPSINPGTRTFTVEVTIPNGNLKLRPGMFCRATIHLGDKQGVLLNDLALQKQMGTAERYVYVIKDGAAERRTVTIGRQIGNQYDILSGLSGDEEVVISGASRLSNGTKVTVAQ